MTAAYTDDEFEEILINDSELNQCPDKITIHLEFRDIRVNPSIGSHDDYEYVQKPKIQQHQIINNVSSVSKKIFILVTDIMRYIVGSILLLFGTYMLSEEPILVALAMMLTGISIYPFLYRFKKNNKGLRVQILTPVCLVFIFCALFSALVVSKNEPVNFISATAFTIALLAAVFIHKPLMENTCSAQIKTVKQFGNAIVNMSRQCSSNNNTIQDIEDEEFFAIIDDDD